jgi:hypothetical protein
MGADCGNKEPGLFSSFAGCCDSRRGVGLVPQRKLHVEGGGDGRPAATWQGRPGASGDSGGGKRLSTPRLSPQAGMCQRGIPLQSQHVAAQPTSQGEADQGLRMPSSGL